jgi:hypothetical protein
MWPHWLAKIVVAEALTPHMAQKVSRRIDDFDQMMCDRAR